MQRNIWTTLLPWDSAPLTPHQRSRDRAVRWRRRSSCSPPSPRFQSQAQGRLLRRRLACIDWLHGFITGRVCTARACADWRTSFRPFFWKGEGGHKQEAMNAHGRYSLSALQAAVAWRRQSTKMTAWVAAAWARNMHVRQCLTDTHTSHRWKSPGEHVCIRGSRPPYVVLLP